ncbi:hypothetical protein ACF0H5_016254 [Mactra antiquata]
MFHLKYPRFRGFFAWDELGCLSRALGFPIDIFKSNLSDEILAEENGLPLQEAIKVLDHKLLYKHLHLTQNLHTADWNTCVFRKCLYFLDHRAITYGEIYNARVAYQTYETGDMKGMSIDQQLLMRTLRMCDKVISPLKLMHRIKHSQDSYEEPGRIQLYEFLDLLLWADGYKGYIRDETYGHFEMEGELFKLTDFDQLLCHHDEREANRLNTQYLKEEWEFPEVRVKDKTKFKDSTVVCADSRQDMTIHQKQSYRHLRSEITTSQKTVHYVKGGFVRKRPVTAPNLKVYSQRDVEEFKKRQSLHVQNIIYNKLHDLLRHAYNKDKNNGIKPVDMSDKPVIEDYIRDDTKKCVTDEELKETVEGWERLLFDIETEEGRYEINRDDEMANIIPKYKERRDALEEARRIEERNSKPKIKVRSKSPPKVQHDPMSTAVSLAYPIPRLPPSHGRKCDARFRGWYGVRSRKGSHYILMSPHFSNSPKGRVFQHLAKMSDKQIKQIHGDFLYRKSKNDALDQRPVTAPAVMTIDEYHNKMNDLEKTMKGHASILSRKSSGYSSIDENMDKSNIDSTSKLKFEFKSLEKDEDEAEEMVDTKEPSGSPADGESGIDSMYDSNVSVESSLSEKLNQLAVKDTPRENKPRAKSAYTQRHTHLQNTQDPTFLKSSEGRQPRSKSAVGGERHVGMPIEEIAPMPYMDHSKAKIVSVGSMGKVSILESISEAKYWEDLGLEQQKKRQGEMPSEISGIDNDIVVNDGDIGAVYDSVDNNDDVDEYIDNRVSSHNKIMKKGGKFSKTENNDDNHILSMILKEESRQRSKNKRVQSKFSKFELPSNKSTASSHSTKSSRESSAASRRSRSPQHVKSIDPVLKSVSANEKERQSDSKKQVIVKAPDDRSEHSEKPVRKYERLVKRLGDHLTPYMKKQMLKV